MGFFDRDVIGSFDAMFDLDGDGKLSPVEQGMQFDFLERESHRDEGGSYAFGSESSYEDEEEEIKEDIEFMDADEAREYLENNGYDPDDFDLDDLD